MKKLLPLLLLIPLMGTGQKTLTSKDTLTLPVDLSGTLTIGSGITWLSVDNKPKNDTVKVLMLVCDTGKITTGLDVETTIYKRYTIYTGVYWQFGYEVKVYSGYYGFLDKIYYLNQDKSPMRKSVVVWMVKYL